MHTVYLSLGSNIEDRYNYLMQALEALATTQDIALKKVSPIYETKAWGNENQADFLNLCCEIATTLSPIALLKVCQAIEHKLQRVRKEHWGPRTIDIDILLYDDKVEKNEILEIPHPYMHERAFVLKPLVDIISTLKHPVLQCEITTLLNNLDMTGIQHYED